MKKVLVPVVLAVCAVSLMGSSGCKKEKANPETAPQAHIKEMVQKSFEASKKAVAVNVNGHPITVFMVLREMNILGPRYIEAGAEKSPALDQKVRSEALSNVIFWELAVQEARKRNMQVAPPVLEDQVNRMKKDLGTEGAYRNYLETNSLSEAEFRKMAEDDALFEMIAAQEVDAKVTVSEAAVRQQFNKEKAALQKDSSHKQITFEQAKDMIAQKLRQEAIEKRMRAWEKELKKNAKIEIVDPTLLAAQQKKGK